ncbi:MAG TPA: S-layer homology domain-containing protein, partial [Oscillospiraceae bacterium]|nr:S-layer homology domain-containing protein [Oscillospiraceae bacterium]
MIDMKKRLSALLLSCALLLGLWIPGAAAADFTDISDQTTAEAAAVLSSLGIVSGDGSGSFYPNETLTRAQFSKMVVLVAGLADEVAAAARQTSFSDVTSRHWAAGYVNLAHSNGYIMGDGAGLFHPEEAITYGQAVTVLLRILGYTSSEIGSYWPADYVSAAERLGLSDGVTSSAYDTITRGEAAILLCNLLRADTAAGKSYASTIAASTVEDALVLSVGESGASVYANGETATYTQEYTVPTAILGLRGTLLLNSSGEVAGFVPDGGKVVNVTVSAVTAASITGTSGVKYAIPSSASLIASGSRSSFELGYASLTVGATVRLFYSDAGQVDLVYLPSSTGDAVVAKTSTPNTSFASAFGLTVGSYSIVKNGATVSASSLAQYDVATYDAATNSLLVSDFKLTGYYAGAYPSASSPSEITLFGHTFEVTDAAREALAGYSIGSRITVLLTADFRVAAVYSATTLQADSPIGVLTSVSGSTGKITLTNGLTLSGALTNSSLSSSALVGSLVNVSSGSSGLTLSALSYGSNTGKLNVAAGTIGSASVAGSVKLYERAGNSVVTEIALDDILVSTVAASDIDYVRYNSAGEADLILLNDATGDAYTYGLAVAGEQNSGSGATAATHYP